MPKLFNPHDLILILLVVVLTHWLFQNVYKTIDSATA